MSRVLKSNSWQPSASLENIQLRAKVLAKIRSFFATRNVLEVETPLLGKTSIPDPNIHSITANYYQPGSKNPETLYLQTSPEFAMKRLLTQFGVSIYQICKAFRSEEAGRLHNPEFTMLEWYRIGFDHHKLMDEMDDLLKEILNCPSAERLSYRAAFSKYLGINPHKASLEELKNCAISHGLKASPDLLTDVNPDTWLNALLCHFIEPNLGKNSPTFIYDYPASQAALARIQDGVASRFEVYIEGIEIANGFYELKDAKEQRQRFENDLKKRAQLGLPTLPIDENFLSALEFGLPDCAGVALGVDRLIMVAAKVKSINEVMALL